MDGLRRYQAALAFAAKKHEGQFRRGGLPYITHPIAVAEKVKRYGTDYQIAALFHDLLEDTDAAKEDILRLGNARILRTVVLVTKEDGYDMADYISRIKADEMAFVIKGADRLHNLESAAAADEDFIRSYIEETEKWYLDFHPGIRGAVARLKALIEDV